MGNFFLEKLAYAWVHFKFPAAHSYHTVVFEPEVSPAVYDQILLQSLQYRVSTND